MLGFSPKQRRWWNEAGLQLSLMLRAGMQAAKPLVLGDVPGPRHMGQEQRLAHRRSVVKSVTLVT